jgi:putative hydrolase of the HAD superfamily
MVAAVTFDYWNTLMREPAGAMRGARREAVLAAAAAHGAEIDAEGLDEALHEVSRRREADWLQERHFSPADGAAALVDALGLDGALRDQVVADVLAAGGEVELTSAPYIGDCLERLRSEGRALGIVCDAGLTGGRTLRRLLEREGLLHHFSASAFSDEVGSYKPSPLIFEATLTQLGAAPAAAVHVGDLRRTDIAGARAFGMGTVRYCGFVEDVADGPEADFVIDDHRKLPALLAGLD